VIAERVETEEQLQFLRGLSCDEYQGYFMSKPLPAAEFEARMRAAPTPAALKMLGIEADAVAPRMAVMGG
jgi:diguanylate cyclase